MIRRSLALLFVGLTAFAGWSLAQDPQGGDDPPVRLEKKKKNPDRPPQTELEKKKDADKKGEDKKGEPEAKQPDMPEQPDEDEAEIAARVTRNLGTVEDRLTNNELNDGTLQLQDDILKDLDALIKKSEEQQEGGGAQQNDPSGGGGQQKQSSGGKSGSGKGQQSSGGKQTKPNATREKAGSNGEKKQPQGGMEKTGMGMNEKGMNEKGMAEPGMGEKGSENGPNGMGQGGKSEEGKPTPGDKSDTWGHLPESLRPKMNAYQTRKNYQSRNTDLVEEYRKRIASPGRDDGD